MTSYPGFVPLGVKSTDSGLIAVSVVFATTVLQTATYFYGIPLAYCLFWLQKTDNTPEGFYLNYWALVSR